MKASEHLSLFERVLAYLSISGTTPSPESHGRARDLVSAVTAEDSAGDMSRALELVPAYLDIPSPDASGPAPRLQRGSIGYWPNAR